MSSVAIQGNASGAGVFTIASPNSASSYTATLPAATTTLVGTDATQTLTNKTLTSPTVNSPTIGGTPVIGASLITSGTAVTCAGQTSIDFTSIPSWVKRITVMLGGVSLSATGSNMGVRIGSGSFEATGYVGGYGYTADAASPANADTITSTTQFTVGTIIAAADTISGLLVINNISGNLWAVQGTFFRAGAATDTTYMPSGSKTTSGVLDRVQLMLGTAGPNFDAGTVNILYE